MPLFDFRFFPSPKRGPTTKREFVAEESSVETLQEAAGRRVCWGGGGSWAIYWPLPQLAELVWCEVSNNVLRTDFLIFFASVT